MSSINTSPARNEKSYRRKRAATFWRFCMSDVIASEAETGTSFYGLLAGITFTASVLAFSFRTSFPLGDVFLSLTLVTTVFFIYSASLTANASGDISLGKIQDAQKALALADHFGIVGFFMMLAEIGFMGFYIGWQYGILVIATIIGGFLYIYARYMR